MFCKIGLLLYCVLTIGLHSVALADLADLIEKDNAMNATVGELLLEIMIKMAASPNEWSKVHSLLANIDNSTLPSKSKLDVQNSEDEAELRAVAAETDKNLRDRSNKTGDKWPTFQNWFKLNKADVYQTVAPEKYRQFKPYSKKFTYHKVTGQPLFLNKNSKAYLTVSVIAPKQISPGSKEDLFLEKELRQLKPWTHKQNLKNMASIRSRWIIRKDNINNLLVH